MSFHQRPILLINNLEKQIIEFFKYLCKNGNTFMQNYLKKQHNNSASFNMILMVNEFTKASLTHLHFPVAYDTFSSCLSCTLEFIQGPNIKNQNILINNDFVQIANEILKMKYHIDGLNFVQRMKLHENSMKDSISFSRSKRGGKHNLFHTQFIETNISATVVKTESKVLTDGKRVTLPSSNYTISLAKYRCWVILNHLLDGHDPSDYIYYLYRREISPDVFRMNFAYQHYFFTKFNNMEFKVNNFFQYNADINKINMSPFIIEIGFQLFFLLKKMEDNFKIDYDERYNNR
jgi:hypothetical protein